MVRTWLRLAGLAAAIPLAVTASLAEEPILAKVAVRPSSPPSVKHDFISRYLTPQMASKLAHENMAGIEFGSRAANPWIQDSGMAERVQRNAMQATYSAVKNWTLERLNAQAPSFAISRRGSAPLGAEEHARIRFGVANLAPRGELLVPSSSGRFRFSADARGRLGTGFDTSGGGLRFGATIDPLHNEATVGLTKSF